MKIKVAPKEAVLAAKVAHVKELAARGILGEQLAQVEIAATLHIIADFLGDIRDAYIAVNFSERSH